MNQQTICIYGGPVIGCLVAFVCLFFALRAARRKRLVDNIPTSKTTGVFIGLVELNGSAEVETPIRGFLAEIPCVFHKWDVEEHWSRTVTETYTDSKGNPQTRTRTENGWSTVASGGEMIPFYLKDDCGIILVRPEGADIQAQQVFEETCGRSDPLYYAKGPAAAVSNSDHRRRFTEQAIPLHAVLYVMGQARERENVVAPEIARDASAPMFLISTKSEAKISGGLAWQYWCLAIIGLLVSVAGMIVRTMAMNGRPETDYPIWIVTGTVFIGIWFLGWLRMAFNSMVELKQRVRQAWSNVDVQLKRRNDLIPKLVEIVKGLKDYERNLQSEVIRLRTELTATPPGESGPNPSACLSSVTIIAERYPELKTSNAFLLLQEELSCTEDRISLARSYFNDIATFYNTRLETIPDRYIAAIVAMKPQSLMTADDFERKSIQVNLAE
jgi:hypothetical protein